MFSRFCAQWEFSTNLKWFVLKSPPGISAPQHRSMSPNSSQKKQTIRLNSAKFFSETCACLLLEVSFFLLSSKGVGLGWIWYFCQFSNTSWLPCRNRNISVFLARVDLPPGNYYPSEVIPVFGWWFTKAYPHVIHVHFTGIIPIRYAILSNINHQTNTVFPSVQAPFWPAQNDHISPIMVGDSSWLVNLYPNP